MKKYLLLLLTIIYLIPGMANANCAEGDICIISKECIGFVNKNLITDDSNRQKELVEQKLARKFKPGELVKVLSTNFFWYRTFVEPLEPKTKNKIKYWIDSRCLIPNK
ncbi:hypothetical protein [Persephonella sp.]|uniref:hypothetical protein n=1 Tax=Persephonella sp. TaxID=2060922 RepID=UPI00263173BE|nr:hypothetical protein [Persephonella sp.]